MLKLLKLWSSKRACADASENSMRKLLKASLLLGVALAGGPLYASPQGAIAAPGPLVGTQEGIVKGFVTDTGIAEFLGIPYATPPLGNLRWKPSKKHEPWAES